MRHLVSGFIVATLAVISSGCGADSTDATAPASVVTVTAPAPTPEPPAEETPEDVVAPDPAADSWVMPNEVGKVLQAAQEHISDVTDTPFFYTDSEDATGAGRFQVLDRGWQVCNQKPAPGKRFTEDTNIVFYVVRIEESCP